MHFLQKTRGNADSWMICAKHCWKCRNVKLIDLKNLKVVVAEVLVVVAELVAELVVVEAEIVVIAEVVL